jgi:S1-C subfamily serine protease/DNA-binding XRE family transcriptional regulator
MTREQLSVAIGVNADVICDWESGISAPDINITLNLCKCYGIKIDTFTDDGRFIRWIKNYIKTKKGTFKVKPVITAVISVLLIIIIVLSAFLIYDFQEKYDKGVTIEVLIKSVLLLKVYSANDELLATGSGFIAIDDTTIITNYHVIENGYKVVAIGDNDVSYAVKGVKGYDTKLDIAILELDKAIDAAVLPLGNTGSLERGEEVIAIGSPFGYKNTVSKGVFSARREIDGRKYIQITAQISRGSSGGALFNSSGEVIGITSASCINGQNLNFAIPAEYINKIIVDKEITNFSTVINDNKILNGDKN